MEAFAKGSALNNYKVKETVRRAQSQIFEIMVSDFPTESAENNNNQISGKEILVSDIRLHFPLPLSLCMYI